MRFTIPMKADSDLAGIVPMGQSATETLKFNDDLVKAGTGARGVMSDLRLRFLREQQAQLDELLRQGDIDYAICVLASQVGVDVQPCEPHRLHCSAFLDACVAA